MNKNYLCICCHSKAKHENEIDRVTREYEAIAIEKRKHPLEWYLKTLKDNDLEYACYTAGNDDLCQCGSFRLDNLLYLESKL